MPEAPLVSVVMSVHNGGIYLAEAIESILNQSFRDFEFIIVDDGSADDTPSVLARYAKADDRIAVHTQEMQGLVASLNTGCGLARGKYIARMDADDASLPNRFERQVDVLEARPGLGAIGGAFEIIDENGRGLGTIRHPTGNGEIREALFRYCSIAHPSVIMRRQAYEDVGGYRAAFLHGEDLDLWLRMAERWELANLPETVIRYRRHAQQVSSRHADQQFWSSLAACLAARIRRLSGSDPMDGVDRVTPEVVARLCASERRITEEGLLKSGQAVAGVEINRGTRRGDLANATGRCGGAGRSTERILATEEALMCWYLRAARREIKFGSGSRASEFLNAAKPLIRSARSRARALARYHRARARIFWSQSRPLDAVIALQQALIATLARAATGWLR